jgi:hypothetical protein
MHTHVDTAIKPEEDVKEDFVSLDSLVGDVVTSALGSQFRELYAGGMQRSLEAFKRTTCAARPADLVVPPLDELQGRVEAAQQTCNQMLETISDAVAPQSVFEKMLGIAGLWPQVTPYFLLKKLAANERDRLSNEWKECLCRYGEALATLQRAERIWSLVKLGQHHEAQKELQNRMHEGWHSTRHPDWLLLEIESNLTIRSLQREIAEKMILPPSTENCVMQLNMGEGKSSVGR